jgi:hypothetical protein
LGCCRIQEQEEEEALSLLGLFGIYGVNVWMMDLLRRVE